MFGKNYYDIGKNKSADEFLKFFRKARNSGKADERERALTDGAAQAFREGRPQNVRAALWNAGELNRSYYNSLAASVLYKITQKSSDKLSDIDSALKGMPEQQKTATLTKALMGAIDSYSYRQDDKFLSLILEVTNSALAKGPEEEKRNVLNSALQMAVSTNNASEALCSLLLESGADANAKVDGYAGGLLVRATWNKAPESLVKLLYDHGASFKDAIAAMVYSGWNSQEQMNMLKFYEERIAGSPPAAAPVAAEAGGEDLRQTISDLKKQLRDLTQVVGALTEEFRRHNGSAPAEAQPQKEPVPKAPHQYPNL